MNTCEIVDAVAKKLYLSKVKARECISTVLDTLVEGAERRGVAQFGKHRFKKHTSKPKAYYNPVTGGQGVSEAKTTIRYKLPCK